MCFDPGGGRCVSHGVPVRPASGPDLPYVLPLRAWRDAARTDREQDVHPVSATMRDSSARVHAL